MRISIRMSNMQRDLLKNEYKLLCPHYLKDLDHCPSAKTIITDGELSVLLSKCCSNFQHCSIYAAIEEKAA